VLGKKSKFSKNQNFGPEKNPKKLKKNWKKVEKISKKV
jgi:hypothetical protein